MKQRFLRSVFKLLLCALLLPYALTLLYIWVNPPSTLMLASWLTGKKVERIWVPLDHISPNLISAVLTSEDDAFCDHMGINFTQVEKSIEAAATSKKKLRGASTISQQTAKNLFLWQGRSWVRKVLEMPLTLWIELVLPKRRILEIYLNISQWGDHIYGIEAASRANFGVYASELSTVQSILLVSALPNPTQRSAAQPGYAEILHSKQVLTRMLKSRPDTGCLSK